MLFHSPQILHLIFLFKSLQNSFDFLSLINIEDTSFLKKAEKISENRMENYIKNKESLKNETMYI